MFLSKQQYLRFSGHPFTTIFQTLPPFPNRPSVLKHSKFFTTIFNNKQQLNKVLSNNYYTVFSSYLTVHFSRSSPIKL
jgi:hypothetical protein